VCSLQNIVHKIVALRVQRWQLIWLILYRPDALLYCHSTASEPQREAVYFIAHNTCHHGWMTPVVIICMYYILFLFLIVSCMCYFVYVSCTWQSFVWLRSILENFCVKSYKLQYIARFCYRHGYQTAKCTAMYHLRWCTHSLDWRLLTWQTAYAAVTSPPTAT